MAKFSFKFLNPKNFKSLSKKQKFISVIVIIGIVLAAAYLLGVFNKKQLAQEEEAKPKYYSQLTGVEVSKEQSELPILGVMIENHPDARPQTGLDAAGIVFETIAEGGITRYLVLYQENTPKEVGPVRSVRHYYLDWAMGFDASLAHVGGAADALDLIEQRNAHSLSQFKFPKPYRRDESRDAPHNMYANTDALRELQRELAHKTAQFPEIPRSDDAPAQQPQAPKVSISFSNAAFAVEFRYQPETNSYVRYLAGAPDVDAATGKPITVKNVAVIWMKTDNIQASGNGRGVLFKDGNAHKINWSQSGYRERIKFTDSEGNEVQLNRGDLWIAALPQSVDAQY